MLQLRETRIVRTKQASVVSGEIISEEGMALVYIKENGETKVQAARGVSGEIFAGVSLSRNSPPAALPYVLDTPAVVPPSLDLTLVRTPIAGQILVKVAGVQKTVVSTPPADATQVQLSGSDLIFFAGEAAKPLFVQMLYTPTVIEARGIIGDAPVGGLASTAESVIGRILDAEISTNHFDASVDWHDAMFVKTAPGGTFTVGTASDHVPNVIVKVAPSGANAFLVLSINVA